MNEPPPNIIEGSTNDPESTDDANTSKYTGFATAAAFSLLAILLWLAPSYIGFSGWLQWICYVVGALSVSISFFGALSELADLLKIEALTTFGVGLIFLVPATLLHLVAVYASPSQDWLANVIKVSALILTALGGFLVFYGMAEVAEAVEQRRAQPQERRVSIRGGTWLTILSFLSAILPIIGFVITTVLGQDGT
jgi:hypothetical protein